MRKKIALSKWILLICISCNLSIKASDNIALFSPESNITKDDSHTNWAKAGLPTLMGNWKNTATGDWEIGFFEDFAIYDSDFWEYESFNKRKKENEIILKKDDKKLNIKIRPLTDSTCTITFGKGKAANFSLCKNTLGDYPVTDNSTFIDNGYQTDSVTITGYIRGITEATMGSIYLYDYFDSKTIPIHIDKEGKFKVKIPVLSAQEGEIEIENRSLSIILEAGEEYFFHYNMLTEQELWMGRNTRLQNEHASFIIDRKQIIPDENWIESPADDLMKRWQEIIPLQQQIFADFRTLHPTISDKFMYYSEQSYRYQIAANMLQKHLFIKENNGKFSFDYMKFVEEKFMKDPVQPHTLLMSYFIFTQNYIMYLRKDWNQIPALLEYFQEKEIIILTPEQRKAFEYYKIYADSVLYYQQINDPIVTERVKEQFDDEIAPIIPLINDIYNDYNLIEITNYHKPIRDILNLNLGDKVSELIITHIYYENINRDHVPLSEQAFEAFLKHVKNPQLISFISNLNNKYVQITNQEIENSSSLKNNAKLKDITEAEDLLKKIIEPYKGKVIYVDFWGSWCSPCKQEMKFYTKPLKKEFSKKNVIFLYLASGTPETQWKNIIKEYELTGETTVHYNLPSKQQKLLEDFFKVQGFPSYYIIDKTGNIADRKAPRPSQKEQTIQALQKWLDQ